MSKLPENIYRLREINVFCVTEVFYCDFVSSEPTRVQNRVHVNKNEDAHFSFARKRPFLRYFFEKTHTISHGIPHTAYRSNIPHQHWKFGSFKGRILIFSLISHEPI